MSTPATTVSQPTAPPVATATPAATVQELKAALPKASADFIVAQLSAGATLAQAKDAYLAVVEADNAAVKEQLANATAKKPGLPGPVGTEKRPESEQKAGTGDARTAFREAVEIKAKACPSMTRDRVVALVARENPELYAALREADAAR